MSSAEKIKKLFAESDVTVSSKVDDRIISDALAAFNKSETTESISAGSSIWRIIMKSRTTRLATAAALSIVFTLSFMLMNNTVARPLVVKVDFPDDINTFVKNAMIEGEQENIQQVLHAQGFSIDIKNIETCSRKHKHMMKIIGIQWVKIDGKNYPCAHLYFSCCGQPVSTFIIDKSRQTSKIVFSTSLSEVCRTQQYLDNYQIVTISPHHSEAIADLFIPAGGTSNNEKN